MLKRFREKYIADGNFYRRVLVMVIPMIYDPPEQTAATLEYGRQYMTIMLAGLLPFGI